MACVTKIHGAIVVPNEYHDVIYSICLQFCETSEGSSDRLVIEIAHTMGAIMNRLRKSDCEYPEIAYDWAIYLVNAVYDLYPNGVIEPEEVRKLKDFLYTHTGCR